MQNFHKTSYRQSLWEDIREEKEDPIRQIWQSIDRFRNFSWIIARSLGPYLLTAGMAAALGVVFIYLAKTYPASDGVWLISFFGKIMILMAIATLVSIFFMPKYYQEQIAEIAEFYSKFWIRHWGVSLIIAFISFALAILVGMRTLSDLHDWTGLVSAIICLILIFISGFCAQLSEMGIEQS